MISTYYVQRFTAPSIRTGFLKMDVLEKIYDPIFDGRTNERKRIYNDKIQIQFRRPDDIVKEITKRRLMWMIHAYLNGAL